jgi:hypothetical protein
LFDSLLGGMQEGMNRWMEFQNGLLNLTQALTNEQTRASMQKMSSEWPSLIKPVSPLPFNGPGSGARKLVWNTFSFAEARAIRGALGGTVNDVVLTALSGAAARYAAHHGQALKGRNLRVMVPVSLRQEDKRGALGNLVSVLPVEIPLDLHNPQERFRFVNAKTSAMKAGRVAEGLNLFSALMGVLPPPMQALVGALSTANIPAPPVQYDFNECAGAAGADVHAGEENDRVLPLCAGRLGDWVRLRNYELRSAAIFWADGGHAGDARCRTDAR